ncbi:MAG: PEP-CTERM sorting domain-containing protein [Rhodospirillaceae bacterium]
MKRSLLAALLLSISVPSHAALYTISWDNVEFFQTDTSTFSTAITPYLAVYGQNLTHVHQQLTIGGVHTIFIPIGWANDQWLKLDGTNSLGYSGWIPQDPTFTLHTVTATPGLPPLVSPTPEPSTVIMSVAGALAALAWRRRQKR